MDFIFFRKRRWGGAGDGRLIAEHAGVRASALGNENRDDQGSKGWFRGRGVNGFHERAARHK